MNIETTTDATTNANGASQVSDAISKLAQAKGITMPSSSADEGAGEGTTTSAETTLVEGATEKKPAEQPKTGEQPAPDAKQIMDRYIAKDAQFQTERRERKALEKRFGDLERQHAELIEALRSDPVAVGRKHGARFGDIAAAELLKGKEGGAKPAQQSDEAPAWAKELRDENKQLREQLGTILKERDDFKRERLTEARTQGIADLLKDNSDFALVNEFGKHDVVLKLVEQHYGDDSDVPDERELQETVMKYSREVERQLRADFDGLIARPSIRDMVAKELAKGGKTPPPAQRKDAKPARPEIEGEDDGGDGAAVLSNDLAQERRSSAPPQEWNKEDALRRTAAEMSSLFKRRNVVRD